MSARCALQVIFYELITQQRYFANAQDEVEVAAMLLGESALPHSTETARNRNLGLGPLQQCAPAPERTL